MRRPFFWPAVGLAAGVACGKFLFLPDRLLLLLLLVPLPFLWKARGKPIFLPLFLTALFSLGLVRFHEATRLPADHVAHFGKLSKATLHGETVSLPEVKERGKVRIVSFVLEAKRLVEPRRFGRKGETPFLFRVRGKVQVFLFNPAEIPRFGANVRLWGKLLSPKRPRNPGEFDYRAYLAQQGIHAVFEGYGPRSQKILEEKVSPLHLPLVGIQRIRDGTAKRLDSLFGPPENHFLKALLLGIRKGLPDEFRDDFMKTGTAHLLAISGMNVTLVTGSFFLASLWFGLPQKGAAFVGLLATVTYVFLSGAGIPVVRAGWMTGLFCTGLLLERERDLLNSLFFALFAILVFDPLALFQVGLQLSFLSVLSLLLLTPRTSSEWGADSLQTGFVLIGTFPLLIFYFNLFSWVSLFANLLAIPLFHFGVLGGFAALAFGSVPWLGRVVIHGTALFLKGGVAWIQFWAAQPWGYLHLEPPSWKLLVFYYAALAAVWGTRNFSQGKRSFFRPLSISLWLVAASLFFVPAGSRNFSLTVLSVGPNELVHVEFPGRRHWLVNAGRGNPSNQARWIVSPFLRRKGVKELQGIFLTDTSRRHAGGVPTLLANFTVSALLFPESLRTDFDERRNRTNRLPLVTGDRLAVGEEGGFRVAAAERGFLFLEIESRGKKFFVWPTWKSEVVSAVLPRLSASGGKAGRGPVDVLILPAFGEPAEALAQELFSLLSPRWVVFPRRDPFLISQIRSATPLVLSESGALKFEPKEGELTVTPFLGPSS